MKTRLTIFLLFIAASLHAQTEFMISTFEQLIKEKSIEERCDQINKKGFMKEGNSPIRLVKKTYNKRARTTFEEAITVMQDTIIYSFSDPKKYMHFKERVDDAYKKQSSPDSNKIIYNKNSKAYVLYETDETRDNAPVKFYNFKFYRKE